MRRCEACLSWKQRSAPTTLRAAAPAGPGATRSHRPSRNCRRTSSEIAPFPPWRLSRSSIASTRSCLSTRRGLRPRRPRQLALPNRSLRAPGSSPALATSSAAQCRAPFVASARKEPDVPPPAATTTRGTRGREDLATSPDVMLSRELAGRYTRLRHNGPSGRLCRTHLVPAAALFDVLAGVALQGGSRRRNTSAQLLAREVQLVAARQDVHGHLQSGVLAFLEPCIPVPSSAANCSCSRLTVPRRQGKRNSPSASQ